MRVLFLTHRLPYPPNRGDRIRAYHLLRSIAPCTDVELVSFVEAPPHQDEVHELEKLASHVHAVTLPRVTRHAAAVWRLAGTRPLTHVLLDSPRMRPLLREIVADRRPDVVLAYCSGMTRFALEAPLAGIPLVIEMVDADSVKWRELGGKTGPPMGWIYRREAATLEPFERRAMRAAFATTAVNDRERDALLSIAPGARVEALPSGIDVNFFRRPLSAPPPSAEVVFCGVMDYAPNVEAAVWLAEDVWPQVRRDVPSATLKLVGSNPTAKVRRLANPERGIEVTGHVPDVRTYLWAAALAAAPLKTARGIQTKVLEAVAAGLPCVVTSVVAAGLPDEVSPACFVADSVGEWANAIVLLLRESPSTRFSRAASAQLGNLSWEERLRNYPALLAAAAGAR